MITSMQRTNFIANFSQSILRDTQAQVRTVSISLIILVHLDKNIGRVIVQRHWIVLIEINTDDIAVPTDSSTVKACVKFSLRLLRALLERFPAA